MFSKRKKIEKPKTSMGETTHVVVEASIKLAKKSKKKWEFFRSKPSGNKLPLWH